METILTARVPDQPSEVLANLRAVEALEYIGNPQAVRVLEIQTKGTPKARLTQEAKSSLQRLSQRASQQL
jgi:hypothetical protein